MITLPNPFESAADRTSLAVDTAVASTQPLDATASQSSTATEDIREAPAVDAMNPHEAAGATDDCYIPELFSVFARRRSMHIVNPPLPQQCRREFEPDMDALFDAIVPPEPPPLFIRKPSEAFMRALFELTH